jgi:hypothetical protein
MKYPYDFEIEASSEEEANTKIAALDVLAKRLKANELKKLAHVVKNDPIKTALAKKALGV